MDGLNINVVTRVNDLTSTQKTETKAPKEETKTQEPVKAPSDGYKNTQADLKMGTVAPSISIVSEEKSTSKAEVAKNVAKFSVIGGTASGVATTLGKIMLTDNVYKPSMLGIGVGVGIGAGVALLKAKASDKDINNAKNIAGSALAGAGTAGAAVAVAKNLFLDVPLQPPSVAPSVVKELLRNVPLQPSGKAIALGAALAGGVAVFNTDVGENKKAQLAKNIVGGALVGAGGTALVVGATSFFNNSGIVSSVKPSTIALGAVFATGFAVSQSNLDSKNLNIAKNAVAGALIGGSALGLASRSPAVSAVAALGGAGLAATITAMSGK